MNRKNVADVSEIRFLKSFPDNLNPIVRVSMTNSKTCLIFVLVGLLIVAPAFSQNADTDTSADPGNTEMNERDRSSDELTADQASQKKSDVEIMKNIRRAIVADDSLSTMAKNIKVISINGIVTLKGPVNSDQERQSIMAKAVDVVGESNVVDKLSVKGEKPSTGDKKTK